MTKKEIIVDLKNKLKLVNSNFDVRQSNANVELAPFRSDTEIFLKTRDPEQLDIYFQDTAIGYMFQHEKTGIWAFDNEQHFYDSVALKDIIIPAMAAIAESLDQLDKISKKKNNNG